MTRPSDTRSQIQAMARAMRESWNPIGFDDSLPADEYVAYAPLVVTMFERGESEVAIAEHLSCLERDAMGLTPRSVDELLPVVEILRGSTRGT